MAIRTNAAGGGLSINAPVVTYIISNSNSIKRGDLLHIENNNVAIPGKDESVDAIAIQSGSSGDVIKCYALKFKAEINNYEGKFTYSELAAYTYDELERTQIKK